MVAPEMSNRSSASGSRGLRGAVLGGTRSRLRLLVTGAVIWVLLALLAAWEFGWWPETPLRWVVLVVVGPIAFLAFSAIGELLSMSFVRVTGLEAVRQNIRESTAHASFSWVRIAYLIVEMLLYILVIGGAVLLAAWAVGVFRGV